MPRILLVDDEPLVTRTLQALILNEMPEIEVYAVNSPVEAMELLKKNMYDVVVTDVSMPRVSGLELLDQVKALWPMCFVIVLTAYNSFDYVYQASRYEDVRFILKIEPPDVMMAAIRRGLDKVRRYFTASEDNQRIRQSMQEALPLLRQTLLERLIGFGEELPENAVLESCGIRIRPGEDTWILVSGVINSREKQHEIHFLVLSSLRDRGFRADAMYEGFQLIFLVQTDRQTDVSSMILSQLDRIVEGAGAAVGLSFAVSDGPVPWTRLRQAGFQLQNDARQNLERSRIVARAFSGGGNGCIAIADALRWRRYLEQRSLDTLIKDIRGCLLSEGYPMGRQSCAMLLKLLLNELFGAQCLEQVKTGRYTAETVLFHGAFDTAESWLMETEAMLQALFSGSSSRKNTETDELVDSINRYIGGHFAEDISLTRIADSFNYNSSYLSRVYKQKMGEGMNEHIIRTRIDAACRLLSDHALSIGDIAERCGFQTAKYFITVLKRSKGMTPKAWRESSGTHDDTG